jgi:hypothetical protein
MLNIKIDKIFFSLFFISFVLYSAYLFFIVKFIFLPVLILFAGFIIYYLSAKNGVYYLFMLFPFINAVPSFFHIGYPHNYLAISLFLFSGIIVYYFLFEAKTEQINTGSESWEKYYLVFLFILFISSVFLFLRWSNITLSLEAFLKDTPVSPSGERLSFGGIFPLLTLYQFSAIPILYIFFKNKRLDKIKSLKFISLGLFVSIIIGLIQKFINDEFMVMRYGFHPLSKKLKNGGFCDQNSFVFFTGIILFLSIIYFYKNKKLSIATGVIALIGGFLSGTKIFYIFIILALILFFYVLKIDKKRKLIIFMISVFVFSLLVFIMGSTGSSRVKKSLNYFKNSFSAKNSKDRFYLLNHSSNGRFEMIINSMKILKKYPIEGVGSGNFLFYNEYQNLDKEHVHDLSLNEYLRILSEIGIIGFLFFSLFIIVLSRKFGKEKLLSFLFILFILGFNNYLWFPESIIVFPLLIYMLSDNLQKSEYKTGKGFIILSISAVLIFGLFNIKDFNKLHPLKWAIEKERDYDYGFWYEERDNAGNPYKWTKKSAGIYISNPKQFKIKLSCGAPLDKLPDKKQTVEIFINGRKLRTIVFSSNRIKEFFVREKKPFFLEFIISPVFNLHKMGLGEEKRELGIIVYNKFKHKGKQSEIITPLKKLEVYQGEKTGISFKIKNFSKSIISSEKGYYLSYHIKDKNGKNIKFDNKRFLIIKPIKPNQTVVLNLPLYFDYPFAGKYIIDFDIVKEGFYWLSSIGWKIPELRLNLKPLISEEFKKKYLNSFIELNKEKEINREQYILRVVLKNSEIRKNNIISGFSPGTDYPQFWIRDIATFIKYGKLFYPISVFKRQVEKFLILEKPDGSIPDWYNTEGRYDKNSVETDQESSLIIAAYEIFISEPEWINKNIKNGKIINLLEKALDYPWENKRFGKYNLIYGGLTADWGDVGTGYSDQRAIKLGEKSTKVFSIYIQAKYIQAVRKLINMFDYLKNGDKVKKWENRLNFIKSDTIKYMYDSAKGYFKIHYYPGKKNYYNIEDKIYATGGNAEAILAGITDKKSAVEIINAFEKKRDEHNLKGVLWTLLPPYPEGFFKHPLLVKPWSYQNGGQWDWIGLRFIKAMFKYGLNKKADLYFKYIIKKHLQNFNIYEWEDKNGIGRGASFYTGAAGIAGDIIFRYYGGFKENRRNYIIFKKNNLIKMKININNDKISVDGQTKKCLCKNKKLLIK